MFDIPSSDTSQQIGDSSSHEHGGGGGNGVNPAAIAVPIVVVAVLAIAAAIVGVLLFRLRQLSTETDVPLQDVELFVGDSDESFDIKASTLVEFEQFPLTVNV